MRSFHFGGPRAERGEGKERREHEQRQGKLVARRSRGPEIFFPTATPFARRPSLEGKNARGFCWSWDFFRNKIGDFSGPGRTWTGFRVKFREVRRSAVYVCLFGLYVFCGEFRDPEPQAERRGSRISPKNHQKPRSIN